MTDIDFGVQNQSPALEYEEAVRQMENELLRQLRSTPAVIRQLTNHLGRAVGKNIRAKSVLICALQRDGRVAGDAVKAAAAVELLHLATLVHDDIIDDAEKRRGIETLHRMFGEKAAILCGDYLVCLALQLASLIRPVRERDELLPKTLPGYLTDVLTGEIQQNKNIRNYTLTEKHYLRIISGKTAAMFEAAFHAGFLLSDEDGRYEKNYLELGRNLGIIFQLADDCADYESTAKTSKKPVMSDFKNGVVTLPLIYALRTDKSLLERIKNGLGSSELKKAVTASGGLSYTHLKITAYFGKTAGIISALPSSGDKKEKLTFLLEKAAGLTPVR